MGCNIPVLVNICNRKVPLVALLFLGRPKFSVHVIWFASDPTTLEKFRIPRYHMPMAIKTILHQRGDELKMRTSPNVHHKMTKLRAVLSSKALRPMTVEVP